MSNTNSAQPGLGSPSNFSGNPQAFNPVHNQNWAISDFERTNELRSPHAPEALQAGSPHTPEATRAGSPHTPEDTHASSPHTPVTIGRSPHAPSPANSSTPSDAYVDAHSRQQQELQQQQQQQEHHQSQQPLQEMGNNSLAYLNSPAPRPSYSTSDKAHSSYEQLPYPMPPPPQSYTVPWQDSEIQPQSSIGQMSPVTVLYSSSQNPGQFQSMSDGPTFTGPTPSDPPKGQAELADAYNRLYKQRRRGMIWGLSLAVILIPTILGCVFGLALKSNGHDNSHPANVTSSMSSSSTFATTSTAMILTSTQPSAPAVTPTDPMTCMQNCNRKYTTCSDACIATRDSCQAACGSDVSCEVSCGSVAGPCLDQCSAARDVCTC